MSKMPPTEPDADNSADAQSPLEPPRSRVIGGIPPEWAKRVAEDRSKRAAARKKA